MKLIITIVLLLANLGINGQNIFSGIYNYKYGFGSELILEPSREARLHYKSFNYGREIRGNWEKVNDTTIHVELLDTAFITLETSYFNDFFCFYSNEKNAMCCKINIKGMEDTVELKKNYYKFGDFYKNGILKWELKPSELGVIETYYYQNGKVKEIISYKKEKLDGSYLKYYIDGRLVIVELWKNGKKKKEDYIFHPDAYADDEFINKRAYIEN